VTELQWHIITPFLDISLVAKIVFLGSCYHQGKKILVEKPLSAERDSRAISLAFQTFPLSVVKLSNTTLPFTKLVIWFQSCVALYNAT